ncbi:excalibur calcium-binding domain-containing protein [Streptomyces sp. NPDC059909]
MLGGLRPQTPRLDRDGDGTGCEWS